MVRSDGGSADWWLRCFGMHLELQAVNPYHHLQQPQREAAPKVGETMGPPPPRPTGGRSVMGPPPPRPPRNNQSGDHNSIHLCFSQAARFLLSRLFLISCLLGIKEVQLKSRFSSSLCIAANRSTVGRLGSNLVV